MLSSLANYLLGGNVCNAQESDGTDESEESLDSFPVMTRLSQVEVEGDDWILINRTVEGATALEESWYVTPPACFTRAGPVNVETSPLEDLLIEHPSMSVYRATTSPVAPDTPPPSPDGRRRRRRSRRNQGEIQLVADVAAQTSTTPLEWNLVGRRDSERMPRRNPPAVQEPARPANGRASTPMTAAAGCSAAAAEKVRIVQLRSAQKVLENRSSQGLKRSRLERGNKLRETFGLKGKRPRRKDRLRMQNSGVNNNRKC